MAIRMFLTHCLFGKLKVCIIATGGKPKKLSFVDANASLAITKDIHSIKDGEFSEVKSVGVIGARQSAIDACIAISAINPDAEFSLISRNLPNLRAKSNTFVLPAESKAEEAVDPFSVMKLYFDNNSVKTPICVEDVIQKLESDLEALSNGVPAWQVKMAKLSPFLNRWWADLDAKTQEEFKQKYLTELLSLRGAVIDTNARKFVEIYRRGKIKFLTGHDHKISMSGKRFEHKMSGAKNFFDKLVYAAGIYPSSENGIKLNLSEGHKIQVGSNSTYVVDFSSHTMLDCKDVQIDGLYALGAPAQGSILVTNSIEQIKLSARIIARHVGNRIKTQAIIEKLNYA